MPTLDEVIDTITGAWMDATTYAPSDAEPEALADHRQLCRNEVEVFLGVLVTQPQPVRDALARLLREVDEEG